VQLSPEDIMTIQVTPPNAVSIEQVSAMVELACRAPSLHNSQPWRWMFGDGVLHLFADHARVGHHTDVTGQEVILSCGAVLDHLCVASAVAGWEVTIDRYPCPRDHDHLASVNFHRAVDTGEHERALGDAIARRHTDRLAFEAPESWIELELELRTVLDGTGVEVDVIDDNGRPALADASQRTEQHRRGDASYRYELLWWTGHSHVDDGIPQSALPSSAEARRVDVARNFPVYGGGDRTSQVDRDRSKVLVLSTFDDSRDNTLKCGEALSRVLLECTAAGFATCPLTHMIEWHESREVVRLLTGRRAEPQVLIRVGRALETSTSTPRTPRRPLSEVLQIR
jgi:hypothetical protein